MPSFLAFLVSSMPARLCKPPLNLKEIETAGSLIDENQITGGLFRKEVPSHIYFLERNVLCGLSSVVHSAS